MEEEEEAEKEAPDAKPTTYRTITVSTGPVSGSSRSYYPIRNASILSSIFNLSNAAIGAGILSFPFAFKECGLITGILITLVMSMFLNVMLTWTVEPLYKNDMQDCRSFEQLVERTLGKTALAAVIICVVMTSFGAMVGFLVILADMLHPVLQQYVGDYWYTDRAIITAVPAFLLVFPLCIPSRIDFLKYPSFLGLVSVTIVVIFVAVRSIVNMSEHGIDGNNITYFRFGWEIFDGIPIIIFALGAALQTPPIHSELFNPTKIRWCIITSAMYTICCITYILIGTFGYLMFLDNTDGNILNNFGGDDAYAIAARVCVGIAAVFSYPLMNYVFRSCLDYSIFHLLCHRLLRLLYEHNIDILSGRKKSRSALKSHSPDFETIEEEEEVHKVDDETQPPKEYGKINIKPELKMEQTDEKNHSSSSLNSNESDLSVPSLSSAEKIKDSILVSGMRDKEWVLKEARFRRLLNKTESLRFVLISLVSLVFAIIIATVVPFIEVIFGIIGSSCGAATMFIFPAAIKLMIDPRIGYKIACWIILSGGILFGAFSTTIIIIGLFEDI